MRVLVEIVHPADVLFYLRPIRAFQARGDEVLIVSRYKDVACDLLDGFGLAHTPLSTAASGLRGLARELITREARLYRLVRRFRPQVMLGFGGVAISHVGRLTGVPAVVHYDSENATMQTRITWPFVHHLTVPAAYRGAVPKGRTRRLDGIKELSYFHPAAFQADRDKALALGLDPTRPNVLVRLVAWRANHDIGKGGWSAALAADLVATLGEKARLHVSAEADLPDVLEPYRYRGSPADLHHLMAHCDALVGESATMASEAVAMGLPALYAGHDFPGYTLGLADEGLLTLVRPEAREGLVAAAAALLTGREAWAARRAAWLARCPDWAEDVVAEADKHARTPW